jgi:Xaa-Pro dipeptidase
MPNPSLDFTRDEYDQRVAAVRGEMKVRDAEVLIVDQFEHLVYLFGFLPTAARYQACILPAEGSPHMVVRALDLPTFHQQSWVDSYSAFTDDDDSIEFVAREVRRLAPVVGSVAIEMDSHFLTVRRYQQLKAALPGAQFVDFSGVMWEQRLIKSASEIAYLRQSAAIADACFETASHAAGEGLSEREAVAVAYSTAIAMGADNGRVLLCSSGAMSNEIHGRLGDRRLETGDILHLELLPQVRGYSSRLMRPTAIGTPSPQRLHTAERLVAIQDEQIKAMVPGMPAAEIDRIGREQVLSEGLREEYPELTGYTLGYHAQPRTSDHTRVFTAGSSFDLVAGMVFHMFLRAGGMSFSETVLVGSDGPRRLTQTERMLFVR